MGADSVIGRDHPAAFNVAAPMPEVPRGWTTQNKAQGQSEGVGLPRTVAGRVHMDPLARVICVHVSDS